MERQPPSLVPYDPELDPPPSRRVRGLPAGVLLIPQEYQRLVANPFLALALFFVWIAAMRAALLARNFVGFVSVLVSLLAVLRMLHYHCLDCGRTGWLFRWRQHACEAVVARQVDGRVRHWRGPTPTVQAVLWLYFLFAVGIVAAFAGLIPLF